MARGSSLAWLGTALFVATAPFVARAQLEDSGLVPGPAVSDAGDDTSPPPVIPTDSGSDASTSPTTDVATPGPTLPSGDAAPPPNLINDTGTGCTCSTVARPASSMLPFLGVSLALFATLRRKR